MQCTSPKLSLQPRRHRDEQWTTKRYLAGWGWEGRKTCKLSQLCFTVIKKRKDTPPPAMRTVVIKMADKNKEWECGETRPLYVDCWWRCKVIPVFGAKLAVLSKGKHKRFTQWNIYTLRNVLTKRWNLKPHVDWHMNLYSIGIHDIPKWKETTQISTTRGRDEWKVTCSHSDYYPTPRNSSSYRDHLSLKGQRHIRYKKMVLKTPLFLCPKIEIIGEGQKYYMTAFM